jgi:pimeloyl-ACP methyl ester carboxylesterase
MCPVSARPGRRTRTLGDMLSVQAPPLAQPDARPAIVRSACPRSRPAGACGYLRVPLDRRHPDGRKIRIYFERYFRTERARPQTSTVLSIEGGPGFSTTADRAARLQLWRPISAHRDLLLVDLRGTGRSGALNCPAFRHHILPYVVRAGRCAAQLGPKRDFYDTSQSVQDLRAVVAALGIHRLDVYGDSYGSYAAQAFAIRYPGLLHSLVLDGTYQLPGSDPALADIAGSTQSSLRLACERRPGCPAGRHPLALLGRLLHRVRRHPIVGAAPDADGTMTHVKADPDTLGQLVQSGFYYQGVWRDIFAATRSAFAGDTRPLLRLVAETETLDGPNGDPRDFTESLYLSVICHDYPELWPAGTPVSQRQGFIRSALASYPPGTFAPFTAREWTGLDYEGALACLNWPPAAFPDPPVSPTAPYPHVPTLILNGDLDNITPLADARVVASRFPDSTLVVMQNSGHVTALLDQNDCASVIYERFVADLSPGDTSCAHRTPEVRVVAKFPLSLSGIAPARPLPGDQSSLRDRRIAAASAAAVADVLQRWWANLSGSGVGLRGGTWSYSGGNLTTFALHEVAFVPGVEVSGTVRWNYSTGSVRATVVTRAGGSVERLRMAWSLQIRAARGRIVGSEAGRTLHLHMLAP